VPSSVLQWSPPALPRYRHRRRNVVPLDSHPRDVVASTIGSQRAGAAMHGEAECSAHGPSSRPVGSMAGESVARQAGRQRSAGVARPIIPLLWRGSVPGEISRMRSQGHGQPGSAVRPWRTCVKSDGRGAHQSSVLHGAMGDTGGRTSPIEPKLRAIGQRDCQRSAGVVTLP
jgi:hypothetical protein